MVGVRRNVSTVLLLTMAASAGCASVEASSGRNVQMSGWSSAQGAPVSQAELQQGIERFTGEFIELMVDRTRALAQLNPEKAPDAMRRTVAYASSALDIASGSLPEVNLLDMLVFLQLCHGALEQYWIPEVFGDSARPLLESFATAEQQLWRIGARVIGDGQRDELRALIVDWQRVHPGQVQVEWVRFSDFSGRAGEVADERASSARGLLGKVSTATQTADQAVLLGERAMFVANRMPFLIRAQVRLGVAETLDDSLSRLKQATAMLSKAEKLPPLLSQLERLTARSEAAAREARALFETPMALSTLQTGVKLADRSLTLLETLERLAPKTPGKSQGEALSMLGARLDELLRRWTLYLVALVAACTALICTGYIVAKRATANMAPADRTPPRKAPTDDAEARPLPADPRHQH